MLDFLREFLPIVIVAAIIGSTPLVKYVAERLPAKVRAIGTPILLILLLLVITGFLVDGSFNPFLYFRFLEVPV